MQYSPDFVLLLHSIASSKALTYPDNHELAAVHLIANFNRISRNPFSRVNHFIFSYGSLMNPQSRLRTIPSSANSFAMPVFVSGLRRSWSYNCLNRYTAVGVDRVSDINSLVNGVLVPLSNPSQDLALLDKREADYIRTLVSFNDIYISTNNKILDLIPLSSIPFFESFFENTVIWVYENPDCYDDSVDFESNSLVPSPSVPIPQSYIDCILQGCLLYSESFARQFISLTYGWDCAESLDGSWLNDRKKRKTKIYASAGMW